MQIPRVTSLGALASLTILGETAAQGGLSFAVSTFKNGLLGAAAFAAVIAGVNVASAAPFTYNGYTVANEQNINILTPNTISGGAGQVTLIGAGANSGQNLLAWCLDVYDGLASSGTYTIAPLTTAGAGGSNPSLTTTQIGEIGALMKYGDANIAADVSPGIQLAIWQIEYPTFAYTGLSSGAIADAATFKADAIAGTGVWAPEGVNLLSEDGNQNLGDWTPSGGGGLNTTPLPAALPLFATGLGAFGLLGWRRKRKSQAAA
jgi:hypothetical protein